MFFHTFLDVCGSNKHGSKTNSPLKLGSYSKMEPEVGITNPSVQVHGCMRESVSMLAAGSYLRQPEWEAARRAHMRRFSPAQEWAYVLFLFQ